MDRFIVKAEFDGMELLDHLKSSLDRFIAIEIKAKKNMSYDLKSSLDRFIVNGQNSFLNGFNI